MVILKTIPKQISPDIIIVCKCNDNVNNGVFNIFPEPINNIINKPSRKYNDNASRGIFNTISETINPILTGYDYSTSRRHRVSLWSAQISIRQIGEVDILVRCVLLLAFFNIGSFH